MMVMIIVIAIIIITIIVVIVVVIMIACPGGRRQDLLPSIPANIKMLCLLIIG